jgi:SAM-dependent methyltransferase
MMETHCENRPGRNQFRAFWERMALHYPLPFDDKTLAHTRRVLSLVKSKGVEFSGASVLDIGCGNGTYALPLGAEAARVTGLDDSETMIRRMIRVMEAEGIQNVRVVKAAWKDIDISAHGFEKAFDIAWISMSPAVQKAEDFVRMERCARKWCVYIGWGRKRKNSLMEEIFRLHGIQYGPPPGAGAAHDILARSGKKVSLDYLETSWEWSGTTEDALEDAVCFLEINGERAHRDLIRKTLDLHERNGFIHHTTYVEEAILVWPVN